MATLNDLRTKGGWIIAIIVAIAMIAFILGDFINSSASMVNERRTRVGEINGEKIGYAGFYNRVEELSEIYRMLWGVNSFTNDQYESIYNAVWQQYFMENVYEPGFKKLGLNISQAEQVDMINGTYVSPVITSMFTDPTTGTFNSNLMMNFLANVDISGEYRSIWNYLKRQMIEDRLLTDYIGLVSAAFVSNNIEVDYMMEHSNNEASGKAIAIDYNTISDSLIINNLSDADVRKYYNDYKETFKRDAYRTLSYVVFDVLPTDADFEEAAKTVAELTSEFEESKDPMQYASLNSQETVDTRYYKESELPAEFVSYAFGSDKGKIYGPVLVGETYTIARLADLRNMPDSLSARHILLAPENSAKADSLIGELRRGADFAAMANEYSIDQVANMDGGNLGTFAPEEMISDFSDACIDARVGEYFTVSTSYGTHIVQLLSKSGVSPKAQFATIIYNVDPSEATQQEIYNKASNFLTATGNTLEGFQSAVTNEGLSAQVATLSANNKYISGLDNSKEIVRWCYNGKQGDVSSIFEIEDKYIVAALSNVVEEGYAPIKEVSPLIVNILKNTAKTEYVAEQVKGLSMDAIAEKFNADLVEVGPVSFDDYFVDRVGMEPKFLGAFCNTKAGSEPAVIEGISSIVVYQVDNVVNTGEMNEEAAKVALDSYGIYYLENRLDQAVNEECKVIDNRVKYF